MAAAFASPFEASEIARWLGWWHDAGKVCPKIQAYLKGSGTSHDHSSVGMLEGIDAPTPAPSVCVAGHHGGLPNVRSGEYTLQHRIKRKQQDERITSVLKKARTYLKGRARGSKAVCPDLDTSKEEAVLQLELWIRFLHSALVDADYLDTEAHFSPSVAAERTLSADMDVLLSRLQQNQRQFGKPTTELNRIRNRIYETALSAGSRLQGLFSMAVPTGGGKTRSAMAFALRHAAQHGLKRVLVALPYTTIIDQNAEVYRDIFGADVVLEDHSATGRPSKPGSTSALEERRKVLAAENWDVPIVVTTTVQLLETLFSNQNRRLRKLHRYAESVIVLDEVQTIPAPLVEPTLWVLRELTRRYGTSVLLSTATQPDYGPIGHYASTPIIEAPEELYKRMQRVRYDVNVGDAWTSAQVAQEMETASQALTICNTTADAERVARASGAQYLSTRLCRAHRERVLETVTGKLENKQPVRLVSTQVVEAGVDISFPLVMRDVGPLDAIIQAAGRCNRERESKQGRVVIFKLKDGGCPPPPYETGRDIALDLLKRGIDLHAPDAAQQYFEALYSDFPPDKYDIQQMRRRFDFEDVADAYRLIGDDTIPVVVDHGDGFAILENALDTISALGYMPLRVRRALQPYTVNVQKYLHEEAESRGLVQEVAPDVWRWEATRYDATYGIQLDDLTPKELVW